MATTSICAQIKSGKDLSCSRPVGKYYQEMCLMNFTDIDPSSVDAPWVANYQNDDNCHYHGSFDLKAGKTGYKFKFPDRGNAIYGSVDVAEDDNGYTIFTHHINALMASTTEDDKCTLDALAKGLVVAAVQFMDGTVEIYGLQFGLKLDDTTIDPANNGGVTPVVLSSREGAEEAFLPLNYKATGGGDAEADFNDCFSQSGS